MIISVVVAAAAAVGLVAAQNMPAGCTGLRRDWNDLSASDQMSYINAFNALAARPSCGCNDPRRMSIEDFSVTHANVANYVHGTTVFLAFHRLLIGQFEAALDSTGLFSAGYLPFWNWPKAQSFADVINQFQDKNPINNTFGTYGADGNNCVLDGAFAKGLYSCHDYGNPGNNKAQVAKSQGCLQRAPQSQAKVACSASEVASVLSSSSTYDDLWSNIGGCHAAGHYTMGGDQEQGDLGDFYYSPNDPFFYLHHAMVDRVWWLWQTSCPSQREYLYGADGVTDSSASANVLNVDQFGSLDNIFPVWESVTVRQVIDSSKYCYASSDSNEDSYFRQAADQSLTTTCPDPPGQLFVTATPTSTAAPSHTNDPVREDKWMYDLVKQLNPPTFGGNLQQRDVSDEIVVIGTRSPIKAKYGFRWNPKKGDKCVLEGKERKIEKGWLLLDHCTKFCKLVTEDFRYDSKTGKVHGNPKYKYIHVAVKKKPPYVPAINITPADKLTNATCKYRTAVNPHHIHHMGMNEAHEHNRHQKSKYDCDQCNHNPSKCYNPDKEMPTGKCYNPDKEMPTVAKRSVLGWW